MGPAKLGQLKATIAQYFRVDGGSTQHRGVVPDIDFNTIFSDEEYGERALQNALPWSAISPVTHHYWSVNDQVIINTSDLHKRRVKKNDKFISLVNLLELDHKLRNQETISLLESSRKKEYEQYEATRTKNHNYLKNTEDNLNKLDDDDEYIDVLLDETANIAADLSKFLKSQTSSSFVDRNY